MTTLAKLLHLDDGEFPELRAKIEAKPIPARPASRRENWGRDMIAFLREQDAPVPPTALRDAFDRGAWLPASVGLASVPLAALELPPTRDLIEYQVAVSCAMHADYAKHLDTLAVFADISAARADAADTHALQMALAPVEALLEAKPTDPRYGHRAFLDIDNANKLLADVHVSATHALDDTYWSVTGRVNAAAALVPLATPNAEVA